MSSFLAFRKAAFAVLRPQHIGTVSRSALSPLFQQQTRTLKETRTHPKNAQIPYDIVQVKDADGTLHHAQKLTKVLEGVDTATHVVRLISHEPPIVRVLTQIEDKTHILAMKARKKVREEKRHILNKEAQLSWFTAPQDFEHKIQKIYEDLEKGDIRVDVVFNPKPKVRNPTRAEMLEQLAEVQQKLSAVSVEWREREFIRGTARMFLQSTVKKEKLLPTQEEVAEKAKEDLERAQRQLLRKKRKEESLQKERAANPQLWDSIQNSNLR
ncbi:hypothetical protein CPC08DRAFT_709773 [Agrocybe pediades]|nr:hypothetical protein CPC08DRAFT_709773 [Agrocybe pediades]